MKYHPRKCSVVQWCSCKQITCVATFPFLPHHCSEKKILLDSSVLYWNVMSDNHYSLTDRVSLCNWHMNTGPHHCCALSNWMALRGLLLWHLVLTINAKFVGDKIGIITQFFTAFNCFTVVYCPIFHTKNKQNKARGRVCVIWVLLIMQPHFPSIISLQLGWPETLSFQSRLTVCHCWFVVSSG